ncbi:sulfotransferase family protein [Amaricoccus tamworthensis]|uniref:sulfotransferase family protein n=1 Tax=Amaricoccus tamworthensis TaxID=57002 RepID=UPI003C7C8DB1
MTMPNFLYIGAPRAGSTWIFEALRAHPQVFVPIAKYVKYYFDEQFHRGQAWYESHFDQAGPKHAAVGEVTTGYLYSESALRRIADDIPNAKILVSVRNPVERDWSAYLHMKRNANNAGSFAEEMNGQYRFISEYGRYDHYLPKVFELFPRGNVNVMFYDDLKADPKAFLRSLYGFLGVDPMFDYAEVDRPKYVAREARSPAMAKITKDLAWAARRSGMPNLIGKVKKIPGLQKALYRSTSEKSTKMLGADDRRRLQEKHRDGIKQLELMLDRDLSHWLDNQ